MSPQLLEERRVDPTYMPTNDLPSLAIIIISWNTCRILQACLESVYQNPPNVSYEVWVVDNASEDASVDMIKESFPQVHLIENTQNIGFAGANNQAIEQSSSRYVLLLNSDTLVYPGTFDHLVSFLESHEHVGATGSRYFNPDGSLQMSCYPFPSISREFWRLLKLDFVSPYGTYSMSTWPIDQARSVDVLQGASLLVRREIIDSIGLLDNSYFMYSEEVDFCYRLKKAGWDLYWVPQSTILHYGGQSTKQMSKRMFIQLYQSKLQFFQKHYGSLKTWIYKLILVIASATRVLGGGILWLLFPKYRTQSKNLVNNYINLLSHIANNTI